MMTHQALESNVCHASPVTGFLSYAGSSLDTVSLPVCHPSASACRSSTGQMGQRAEPIPASAQTDEPPQCSGHLPLPAPLPPALRCLPEDSPPCGARTRRTRSGSPWKRSSRQLATLANQLAALQAPLRTWSMVRYLCPTHCTHVTRQGCPVMRSVCHHLLPDQTKSTNSGREDAGKSVTAGGWTSGRRGRC